MFFVQAKCQIGLADICYICSGLSDNTQKEEQEDTHMYASLLHLLVEFCLLFQEACGRVR